MEIVLLSSDIDIVEEWQDKYNARVSLHTYDLKTLEDALFSNKESIVVVDYDTMAAELNKLIAADNLPKKVVVLESVPEILTGKMLISHGVKAYANTRMLSMHYKSMLEVVQRGDIWTYPKLTAAITKQEKGLSEEAEMLLEHRLTQQEKKVVLAVVEGLTNEAIAHKLGVTIRTVKAHITSIFSKLHVNDRLGLVLLLK